MNGLSLIKANGKDYEIEVNNSAMNPRFCLYCRYGFRKGEDYKKVFSKSDVLQGYVHIRCVENFLKENKTSLETVAVEYAKKIKQLKHI